MAQKPALEIKNLNIIFNTLRGQVHVLKNLSYTLLPGQTLCVVGESGSGKTVHCLSILRLLPPNAKISGEIIFGGKNILAMTPAQINRVRGRKIAMIFQDPMTGLNPVMRVSAQITETLLAHKITSKKNALPKAIDLLKQVGIKDAEVKIHSYPHEFSGGQRQRIMIAMALACEPDILIADEPTTALDVTVQKQIIALLRSLQAARNMALIFITHNLALVSELGGTTLVLYAGQSVEEALTKELFAVPLHPYTKALIESARPAVRGQKRLPAIEGAPPAAGQQFPGCPFEPRCARRMAKCHTANPPVFEIKDRKSRCYLSEND